MKTIVVKAGKHYSKQFPKLFWDRDSITFEVEVDESWIYRLPENNGISKIRGISWGNHHKDTSARLGFICGKDGLELWAYCYINGVSPQQNSEQKMFLRYIKPGERIRCTILKAAHIQFEINGVTKYVHPVGKTKRWGYELNPYIGGSFTLDHDVKFKFI